jgi:hypothetical protein
MSTPIIIIQKITRMPAPIIYSVVVSLHLHSISEISGHTADTLKYTGGLGVAELDGDGLNVLLLLFSI